MHTLVRILGVIGLLASLGIGLLLTSLWLEHRTETALPMPTGPFAVGRATYVWADDEPDTLAPVPGATRELAVWIWYPAANEQAVPPISDYLPAALRAEIVRGRGALISSFLTRDLAKVQAHSAPDVDVAPQQRSYPVVVMRAGASAEVTNYSTLAEDLASHGYVVVGFDAPYRTNVVVFPDGRVIRRTPENNPEACLGRDGGCAARLLAAWTADIGFALDRLAQLNAADASNRFTGRLDLTRVGVFGHSFGGAAAAWFCHEDSRCRAGIDVDGAPHGPVIEEGIDRPFMFLLSDHGGESGAESEAILANIQAIYERVPVNGRVRMAIRGAGHFSFSDDGALLKSHIVLRTLRAIGMVGIDGPRQLAVTAYSVHTFFDAYLKAAGAARLDLSSPLHPEIQVFQ